MLFALFAEIVFAKILFADVAFRHGAEMAPRHMAVIRNNGVFDHFVSGQPLSLALKNALSPGTTASCL